MFPENHFDGGKNLNAGHGEKHLGRIIKALMNDLVKLVGIQGIQTIAVADASPVASTNASDEATLVTLVNEEKSDYAGVVALVNNIKAVLAPITLIDITEPDAVASSVANATNSATAVTLVNDLKAKYNAAYLLLNQLKSELNAEGTIAVAASDLVVEATATASDEATAITLANALKTKLNAAVTMVNEFKTDLNAVEKIELESQTLFE